MTMMMVVVVKWINEWSMKNFNRCSSHGYHGSKRCELLQHAHSCGSHAFTHTLTSTQLQPCGAKRQLSYYFSVHAGSFHVSVSQRTLTWTTGSLACVRDNSCAFIYTRELTLMITVVVMMTLTMEVVMIMITLPTMKFIFICCTSVHIWMVCALSANFYRELYFEEKRYIVQHCTNCCCFLSLFWVFFTGEWNTSTAAGWYTSIGAEFLKAHI